jgi:hypothetical protein
VLFSRPQARVKLQTAGTPDTGMAGNAFPVREVTAHPIKILPGRQNQLFEMNSEIVRIKSKITWI